MAVSAVGGVGKADMVTMRGEGVTENTPSTTTLHPTTATTAAPCHHHHPNGGTPNGDANTNATQQWKPAAPSQTQPQEPSKMAKIRDVVENAASVSSKCVVESLLQQVGQLSDVEKFLLYLKLPVGRPPDADPLKQPLNPLGSRCEIQLTITWIKTHLEMNSEVSLPKREVYNEYMHYCNLNNIKALSTADFGKVMKQVFPGVRPRRLGQRGASKYCYSGLRKKWTLEPPDLPDLNDNMAKKNMLGVDCVVDEGEVDRAATCLVLEWAEKLCSVKFECVRDLALHLVNKSYVDNRSVAAFTLLSLADHKQGVLVGSGVGGGGGGGKHRETQIQLQRKIQEKEHIREQKRKLQQPTVTKCNSGSDRPKSRRRSGTQRNPSGDTTHTPLTNGTPPPPPPPPSKPPPNTSNGNCDATSDASLLRCELENGGGVGGGGILNSISIKQEQPLDFLDTLTDEKILNTKHEGELIVTSHAQPPLRRSCSTPGGSLEGKKTPLGGCKVALSKPGNTKKTLLIMPTPSPAKTASTKPPFKAIQPRSDPLMQWPDMETGGARTEELTQHNSLLGATLMGQPLADVANPLTQRINTQQQQQQQQQQQIQFQQQQQVQSGIGVVGGSSSSSNGGNSHEGEEEVQHFHKTLVEMDDQQKTSQLSELRKLLVRNLPSGPARGGGGGGAVRHNGSEGDVLEPDGIGIGRRRVSFQPSLEGGETLSLVGGQTVGSGSVPPSPNTRRTQFNFLPIATSLEQVQGASQCSSANASPFMSPRNTPLPRSRHNSGQTSSTYVTPRSTPFTPDQPSSGHPIPSESSTPFMSPIPTPLFPRSRHNSSQNLRTIYPPRSRHSSGAPSLRHAPYGAEDPSGRRGGKFGSRPSSGSVPPSPSSAPLSPLVQDNTLHPQQDMNGLQLGSTSMLQLMLKTKPVSTPHTAPAGGMSDPRRRHMSAGPTIHYQPQPPTFPSDPLSQEVTNVLTNSQPGPSTSQQTPANRPQSVPLLQMLNMQDTFAKSQPNTPLVGQQFNFLDCCEMSQTSSYAPTPVPSEYNDFNESYNLEISPLLDVNLQGDASSSVGLDPLDSLSLAGGQSSGLSTLSDPLQVPPNINPFENYQSEGAAGREALEDRVLGDSSVGVTSCCMDPQTTTEGNDVQDTLINPSSMLTLNALNRPSLEVSVEVEGTGLEDDFQPTLADLGDQEVFNSLVLEVNKD